MSADDGLFDLGRTRIVFGLNVLEASAGTGKTWSLSHLVPRLILDGGIERLEQVLLVSFTDDATRELAERVRSVLAGLVQTLLDQAPRPDQVADLPALLRAAQEAASAPEQAGYRALLQVLLDQPEEERLPRLRNLLAARLDADRLVVSTIHSLCKRILSDEGFLCGMPSGFEVRPDIVDLREQALRDVWRQDLAGDPVLALLAVREGWSLAKDAEAWRLLEPADSEQLLPTPGDLAGLRRDLVAALGAFKATAASLPQVQAILAAATLRNSGKAVDAAGLPGRFRALDPEAPSSADLDVVEAFQGAPEWVKAQGAANLEAKETLQRCPPVLAAQALGGLLKRLGRAWQGHALAQARLRLDRSLQEANGVSYNDLIRRLHQALHGPKGLELADRLRQRWRLALVDESQDTDPRQLAIFEKIFNRAPELTHSLTLIGDPKQSIFGFRSADLATYEGARDRPGVPLHRLTTTHRSAEGLVRALNALFGGEHPLASPSLKVPRAQARKSDADLPLPEGEGPRLALALVPKEDAKDWSLSAARTRRAAAAGAAALSRLLDRPLPAPSGRPDAGGRVLPGDCAVLVRSNRQAKAVREALAALGIPAVVRDDGDVFSGEIASDLAVLLRALLQPGHRGFRRAALATRLLGFDAGRLDALSEGDEELWQLDLESWGKAWIEHGVAALLSRLDSAAKLSERLAALPLGERFLTDLRHLGELLQAEEAERRLAPDRLLQWLLAGIAESAQYGKPADKRLQRLEQDGSAVQVLTVHRAKGLEFDYCFLPFLWDAKVPKDKQARIVRLPDASRALADPEAMDPGERARVLLEGDWQTLQEDLRLAYVALTRAKRQAWVLAGWIGYGSWASRTPPSALDWLLRLPRPEEDGPAWYQRMALQKFEPAQSKESQPGRIFHCEQEDRARQLCAQAPGIGLVAPGLEGKAWQAPRQDPAAYAAEDPPRVPAGWRMTSFSALAGDSGAGQRGHQDPDREDGAEQGSPLPLAGLKGSNRVGECLHELLERWDFRSRPVAHLLPTLRKHGLANLLVDERPLAETLQDELPRWSLARIPGLGSLAEAAGDPRLSEWHFVLPLRPQGVGGADLAGAFAAHPDPALRDYALSLALLSPERVQGMLQGYIDRLAHADGRWGVLDWKSNTLGVHAEDFSPGRMLEEAMQHHYVLQLFLYLVALRRYLRGRGQAFQLAGASLVFLRALRADSEAGILHFEAEPAVLDRLDALFTGVSA